MSNESPKLPSGGSVEFGVATVDMNEELIATVHPFIEFASNFPKSVRERLAEEMKLSGSEMAEVAASTQKILNWAQTFLTDEMSETAKLAFLKREVGNKIFAKLFRYLIGPRLLGEYPEDLPNIRQSEMEIRYTAEKFINDVYPLLTGDFLTNE